MAWSDPLYAKYLSPLLAHGHVPAGPHDAPPRKHSDSHNEGSTGDFRRTPEISIETLDES